MAVRVSTKDTDLVSECNFILSAFDAEGDRLAGTLTGLTQPNLVENDEVPGFGSTLVGLRRNVEASLGRVKEASGKVAAAVGWESTLRKELQEKSEEQALILVALRGTVLAQYVEPDMENLALQAVDVRTAPVMLQRSELVSDRFEAPNLAKMLGQARFEDPVDLEPYVRQLRESAKELAALIARVNEAVRSTDRARLDRLPVRKEHEKVVLRSSRVFEDFCRLAGDDALADKIRRTVRSNPSRSQPGDDEGAGGEGDDVTEPIGDVEPTPVGEDDASQEA